MKLKLYFIALILFVCSSFVSVQAQIKDYYTYISGDWSDPNIWLVIEDGSNIIPPPNTPPTASNANIIGIQAAHTVTISTSIEVDQLTNNGILQITTSGTLNIVNGDGTDLNNIGSISVAMGRTLSVGSGCLVECSPTSSISGKGNFSFNSSTLKIGHVNGINGNISTSTRNFLGTLTFEYNNTSNDQVTGSQLPMSLNSLIISGGRVVTLSNSGTGITSGLNLANGILKIPSNSYLDLLGADILGSFNPNNMIWLESNTSYIRAEPGLQIPEDPIIISMLFPLGTERIYSPVDIYVKFTTGGTGAPTGTTNPEDIHEVRLYCVNGAFSVNPGWTNYLNRYWEIYIPCTFIHYNATLYYDDDDIVGGNDNRIKFARFKDGDWEDVGGSINRANNTLIVDNTTIANLYYSGIQRDIIELDLKAFLQGAYR